MLTKIRKAATADLETIVGLDMSLADLHHSFDARHKNGRQLRPHFQTLYRRLLRQKSALVLLAVKDGKAVGFLAGSIVAPDPFSQFGRSAEIEAVYVLPGHKSKGIGAALLKHFVAWARKQKAQ